MEQFLSDVDLYGVLATILSAILATVVPALSFRYRKLLRILNECKELLKTIAESWEDKNISEEEMKYIVDSVTKIIANIKG